MQVTFPYRDEPLSEFGTIPKIRVWFKIKSLNGFLPFFFLFDTGADVTSLPASAARKLGINLDQCPKVAMSGYEGTAVWVYKSKIEIALNRTIFSIPCLFHPNEDVPLLLGRAGIIDRFTVILDAQKKQVVFNKVK